ncbi:MULTISPECIES: hypothetical protein [unclassified Microbacterium]|uniref:hypothetical protein n=1 Tax=unclassified Microbacterium TaxID=2609290 RepID=UPI0016032947|nr:MULTISPECIES: hypothetical protein [unclassified Microbacterium]MBT2484630.1 hypothetical protein [Microbacterium sp. ISL-108]
MTIRTAVLCDTCEAVFVTDNRQPRGQLTARAHADGWTSTNHNGRWTNQCPDHTN